MHADFRPVILLYGFFVILQFATGASMYALRAGTLYEDSVEYYLGSEEAARRFPGREDRFVAPKTIAGIAKTQVSHSLAFGLMFFVLAHLIRSLGGDPRLTRLAIVTFFAIAMLDFVLPFLALTGIDIFLRLRFPIVLLYSVVGGALAALLCARTFTSS
ncbi:MAG: hypothetical protein JNM27_12355 [Leptospirales bacterium]|nr:hypothetical protein [Leptospirales bacterium]